MMNSLKHAEWGSVGKNGMGARRRLTVLFAVLFAVLLALVVCVGATSDARAADTVWADGYVSPHNPNGTYQGSGGAFYTYVYLTQIAVRSKDGHSSCWHAYNGSGNGYTYGYCTNDLDSSTYGGIWRLPHCYSGWSGHYVDMRCRAYY